MSARADRTDEPVLSVDDTLAIAAAASSEAVTQALVLVHDKIKEEADRCPYPGRQSGLRAAAALVRTMIGEDK
jgi:hypothetical protein